MPWSNSGPVSDHITKIRELVSDESQPTLWEYTETSSEARLRLPLPVLPNSPPYFLECRKALTTSTSPSTLPQACLLLRPMSENSTSRITGTTSSLELLLTLKIPTPRLSTRMTLTSLALRRRDTLPLLGEYLLKYSPLCPSYRDLYSLTSIHDDWPEGVVGIISAYHHKFS
jgi:hypothetical protein